MEELTLPTEQVELPSRGLVYPLDNPLSSGKIEMKYMTAKEEDILTNQNYIKDGSVIDKLLKSLIVQIVSNILYPIQNTQSLLNFLIPKMIKKLKLKLGD